MFYFAQDKSTTIEFLKSELMQLLSDMRQEIAASRQVTDLYCLPAHPTLH